MGRRKGTEEGGDLGDCSLQAEAGLAFSQPIDVVVGRKTGAELKILLRELHCRQYRQPHKDQNTRK